MAMALAAPLALGAQAAVALTVEFDGTPGALPYSEGGFAFTQTTGAQASVIDNGNYQFLTLGISPIPSAGDTVEVVRSGGGTFTFDAFVLRGPGAATTAYDVVDIFGLVGGSVTEQLLGVTATGAYAADALATGFSAPVDTVRIVLSSVRDEAVWFDAMTFDAPDSAVPAPAALPLLAAGLGGFALLRRRAPQA
ncbi:PEP-CTERM sorting domain-containing protein [Albimonas sp. CAU 1670]|uniref:PEP-CTERM sorting domain-containing protein n=1 Tax=Albimonas sp. CAU 1670 TaxID=3032599 RepID=UPI0023D9FD31|nr:PEP-CTERM sorting domain-containing protein [Albimonas sp. CAU 1670]MDF2235268.1 PEP-CTERM sorting domain-containing protein [Albimonas sp. CAU 1670]